MKKNVSVSVALAAVFALVFALSSCSASQESKIDPAYYAQCKQVLAIGEGYLSGNLSLSEARTRAAEVSDALDALPLIPEGDPLYKETDHAGLYARQILFELEMQNSETRTLQLHEDLRKYLPLLAKVLGLETSVQ